MKKLKELRVERGLKQKEVADFLNISQQVYAGYENTDRIPKADILEKLSSFFGVSYSNLLDNNETPKTITEFLETSYTAFHAVLNVKKILDNNGFIRLYEHKKADIKKGGKYYITKNSSAIIAFKVGTLENYSFNIAGSHTDSPSLKIKGSSLIDSPEGKRINIEKYGGSIYYSFLDIPLRIAGRVEIKNKDEIKTEIITSKFNVNIPSLCIHHNPTVNDNLCLNIQNDMLPLLRSDKPLYKLLSDKEIIDGDLFCVPDVKPYFSGANQDLLVSPRIDNLTSVYSSLMALINSNPKGVAVMAAFDNEEIGSSTKQGADSVFLIDVLKYINSSLGFSDDEFRKAISNGFNLSIDNGHAVHPAHPEKSDIDNKVYLNNGVVIKHHVNYSTDSLSSAIIKTILEKHNIKYQEYYNRSDVRCGSTIGLTTSKNLAMNTADIGLAQLAMHSGIETVGKDDIKRMEDLITHFFNTVIILKEEDTYEIK